MSEIKTDAGVKERNPSAKGKVKERKGIPFTEKKEHLSLFSDFDIHLFKAGKLYHLYNKLGSHVVEHNGEQGVYFAVWAPNAIQVQVIGNFNGWNKQSNQLLPRWDGSGIWEGFIPGLKQGEYYKYHIKSFNG
jgi:1,4-alpha-glucan branching enzyme